MGGYRCCTRDMFSKKFRTAGMPNMTYHGRTGVIWNVTKRAVGVLVNKQVGGRVLAKKIHVRVEHVSKSQCRKQFLDRVKANDQAKVDAKAAGLPKPNTKRAVAGPRAGFQVKTETVKVAPVKYEPMY